MNVMRCEDEKIQFLGTIQDVGFFIVLNKDGTVKAYSENSRQIFPDIAFNKTIDSLCKDFFLFDPICKANIHNELKELNHGSVSKRNTSLVEIGNKHYYLSLFKFEDSLYLEFEICRNRAHNINWILNNKMIEIQEEDEQVWATLTKVISDQLHFDRVMVYRFNEDKSGVVVAESLGNTKLESYLGLNYPEFDIPRQARELYKKKHCRFIVDTEDPGSTILSENPEEIDLSGVSIRKLSPIHLQYLKNAGFRSSISFSIIIQDELWGLVCCQNESPAHIDLTIRDFALLATNFAANKFQRLEEKAKTQYLREVQQIELVMKEKILLKKKVFPELKNFANSLLEFLESDGIAIGYEGSIYLEGFHPNKEVLRSQLSQITSLAQDHVFLTHSLSDYPEIFEAFEKDIVGIAFAEVDMQKDFFIIWFRKEIVVERSWAGKPEKHFEQDNDTHILKPSPRTSFDVWKDQVRGTSKKWSSKDIHFISRIRELLRDSILQKSGEIESLNKQLIEMNNALDTYAYTISHDLKNPLSAIKVSTEFLQYRQDVKPDMLKKMTTNILDSVDIILNMLDKIHQFSKASSFKFTRETIDPESFVQEIIDVSKQRFGSNNVQVEVKQLLPVSGEKTLLYQLFLNLIGNAIKYSSKSQSALVMIDSLQTDNGVIYTIKDNGIGIAEEELKTIYEMFKRMSNAKGFEGSGVGMAIVKRITDKLGIDITIKSKIGEGTIIKLMFPNQPIGQ